MIRQPRRHGIEVAVRQLPVLGNKGLRSRHLLSRLLELMGKIVDFGGGQDVGTVVNYEIVGRQHAYL